MKQAVCISCTHHYRERTHYVENALLAAGYQCTYITSDFSHTRKEHYKVDMPGSVQIPTLAYKKNISAQRIVSHMRFARDTRMKLEQIQPDLIYVEIPPNSLCRAVAKYKQKHPQVKVIFDIFDLWPESFPSGRGQKLLRLPFGIWARFRNAYLSGADQVFVECDLYRDKIKPFAGDTPIDTLHLCRERAMVTEPVLREAQPELHLCYLGNINNIIDIPLIAELIGQIHALRPVVLHIIGGGESCALFTETVRQTGAQVVAHGVIYDAQQIRQIMEQCSFGLNIMKSTVCIGLTMKSLDYFSAALPILNTIEADTWTLVEQRQIGLNICRDAIEETARRIARVTPAEQQEMARNTAQVFQEMFTEDILREKILSMLE